MHRYHKAPLLRVAAVLMVLFVGLLNAAQPREFKSWPAGKSPTEIGKRVAERFVASPHMAKNSIIYPEVCGWYGSLTFAQVTGDKDLTARLVKRFDPLLTAEEASLLPPRGEHVDSSVFGAVPFELFIQTNDKKYLNLGLEYADKQWENPTPDGLTKETRFWIDDMFMISAVQVQAFRATNDVKYRDRGALEMAAYLDKLQQPNGLFFHAPDVPFYWGRGDGWVAAGMTELLRSLPKNHPKRARILAGYRKMMAALLKYQAEDGMWRQLIDRPESWKETSSTGMFTFAMVTGVKNGWLDKKTYAPAARKAWLALTTYLDANGDMSSICAGTNKKNDYQYYMDRPRRTGDMHGQAPMLWTATALLR
jgi:rhamnogalacturonyl hydrolase YesR